MLEEKFAISQAPFEVPAEVTAADPAQALADGVALRGKLRELLVDQRAKGKKEMRGLLLKLLEVADALDRLLEVPASPGNMEAERLWQSIRVTRRLLDQVLRMQDVKPMDMVGCEADPTLCEVDAYQVRPDLADETVVQEVIRGYFWGEEQTPLRTAVVIVSKRV